MHLDTLLGLIGERETTAAATAERLREQISLLTLELTRIDHELADLATTRTTLRDLAATEFTAEDPTIVSAAYQQILAVLGAANALVADGGMPWRYHPDGSVALASPPKEVRTYRGRDMVLEEGIVADGALIRAAVADTQGNCLFHATARNFNPVAAMAGRLTIVEAERLVDTGRLDPDSIHLPAVFVHRVVALSPDQAARKGIEKRTTRGPRRKA